MKIVKRISLLFFLTALIPCQAMEVDPNEEKASLKKMVDAEPDPKSAKATKLEKLVDRSKKSGDEIAIFLSPKVIEDNENAFREYVQGYVRKEAWEMLNPDTSWTGILLNTSFMTKAVNYFKGVDLDTARKLLGRVFVEDTEEFPKILQSGLDELKKQTAESDLFRYANSAFTKLTPLELKHKKDSHLSGALHKAKLAFPDLPNSNNMDSVAKVPDSIFGPFATLNLFVSFCFKNGIFSEQPPIHPHSRTKKRLSIEA